MTASLAPDAPDAPVRPAAATVREVGPRDGLQVEGPLAPAERVELIEALAASGLREIEAAAFVSPLAVPAMAGAAQVIAAVRRLPGVRYTALVPNVRGAELALEAGVDGLSFTISASATYNRKNVHMGIEESLREAAAVRRLAGALPVAVVVSCAFGSPWEGDFDPGDVAALGRRLVGAGADEIVYADTTGMATPPRVEALVAAAGTGLGLHLHDTRGTALVNAYAALLAGVHTFETAVGGLGGSPFAVTPGGNLATEELVHLLDDLGVESGVDLDRLLKASSLAARLVGHPLPSRLAAAGPRSRRSEA
jgi:hydroxymethylglutaryl-CoA lyase